jgi:hypothetical protein
MFGVLLTLGPQPPNDPVFTVEMMCVNVIVGRSSSLVACEAGCSDAVLTVVSFSLR